MAQFCVEGKTPFARALSIGLGLFIGCLPFYGLHLMLCLLAAWQLRLGLVRMYLAANIVNPLVAPFLLFAEVQIGALLRRGEVYDLSWRALDSLSAWGFATDLLLGSVVVGAVLGGLAIVLASFLQRGDPPFQAKRVLVVLAAMRYLSAGFGHWEFARQKLRRDPVFLDVVTRGLVPGGVTLVDLGCGRGLLLTLLVTYGEMATRNGLPDRWPPPPRDLVLYGIERSAKTAAVAARALDGAATVRTGDITTEEIPPCDMVTLFDVLHYLPAPAHQELLRRIRQALRPGGSVLIREADAGDGWRFAFTRAVERVCVLLRGEGTQQFAFRPATELCRMLENLGFDVRVEPMSRGTPFANVLIQARLSRGGPVERKAPCIPFPA